MSDNLMEKVNALGERLKIGGAEVGRKMSAGMSSVSFKVKEFFQGPNHADKLVEDATSESLDEPDWAINLHICDLINGEELNTGESVRAIKKRLMMRSPRIQYLALVLLEALLKNCDNKGFMEVATERVLDEMVKLIDDPQTVAANRNKASLMIEAWGESTTQLRYLPVYEETYKSLKSKGVRFPGRDNESSSPFFTPPPSASAPEADVFLPQRTVQGLITSEQRKEAFDVARNSIELLYTVLSSSPQHDVLQDDLTTTLVQQCRGSQSSVRRIVESAGDNEALLFEALNLNDEIQKVLSKYEELKKPTSTITTNTSTRIVPLQPAPEPPMVAVEVEPEESPRLAEEDALIRKPAGSRAEVGVSHDDMMDDLDEMIFGKKGGGGGGGGDASHSHKKNQQQSSSKHDLISF